MLVIFDLCSYLRIGHKKLTGSSQSIDCGLSVVYFTVQRSSMDNG